MEDNKQQASFTLASAKRIKQAVLKIEKLNTGLLTNQRRPLQVENCFYAEITERKPNDYKYAWRQMTIANKLLQENDEYKATLNDPEYYAVETTQFKYVPVGAIVLLEPSLEDAYYAFRFTGCGILRAKTIDAIGTQNAGNVRLYKNGSEGTDTIQVWNAFKQVIPKETTIFVDYSQLDKRWYVVSGDC